MDLRDWFNCQSCTDAVDSSEANAGELKLYVMNYTAVKGSTMKKEEVCVAVKQVDKNNTHAGMIEESSCEYRNFPLHNNLKYNIIQPTKDREQPEHGWHD